MYAAIRQGRAKAGMAEELAGRIKEGAIPIIVMSRASKRTTLSMRQTTP